MIEKWKQHSAMSSLAACHEFYCPDDTRMEKETRNVFVKTEKSDYDQFIRDDAERLLDYCANDVQATLSVFRSLYERDRNYNLAPKYLQSCAAQSSHENPLEPDDYANPGRIVQR